MVRCRRLKSKFSFHFVTMKTSTSQSKELETSFIIHNCWHTFFKLMNFINFFCCWMFRRRAWTVFGFWFRWTITLRRLRGLIKFKQINSRIVQIIMGKFFFFSSAACHLNDIHCLQLIPNLVLNQNYFVDSKCHLKFVFNHAMCARFGLNLSIINTMLP